MSNFKIDKFITNNSNGTFKKLEIDCDYYEVWAIKMKLLFIINGLEECIEKDMLPKINKTDSEYEEGLIKVIGTSDKYYKKKITKDMIKEDCKAKWLISENISDELLMKVGFEEKSSYDIWNNIKISFKKSNNALKTEIKNELDEMKYDRNEDFNLFLSNMINKFNKLRELNAEPSSDEKFDYLWSALPDDIQSKSNMMEYQDDWDKCCSHMIKSVPRLKQLKDKEIKKTQGMALYSYNKNNNFKKYNSFNRTNNVICYKCNKRGHIAKYCPEKQITRKSKGKYINKNEHQSPNHNKRYNKRRRYQANNAEDKGYDDSYSEAFTADYNNNEENQNNLAIVLNNSKGKQRDQKFNKNKHINF
jgi:hypothetical protein